MGRPVFARIHTRKDVQRRIFALVGFMAALQLLIDAAEPFVEPLAMLGIRIAGAWVAGMSAIRFEMHKSRRSQ